MLKKAKSVYYPPPIRASSSSIANPNAPLEVANPEESNPSKVLPSSGSPPKVVEQLGVNKKVTEETKVVASDATKPPAVPRILLKTKRCLGWSSLLQLFQFLPKVTLKAQAKDPRRLLSHSPRPLLIEKL